MKSPIVIALLVAVLIIGGSLFLTSGNSAKEQKPAANNVSIVDGVQVVLIEARGGYEPEESVAKAGIPTIIRFKTNGTFDCSTVVRIPSLKVYQTLPQTGETDIQVGTPTAGKLKGSCGMGMYPFSVTFES